MICNCCVVTLCRAKQLSFGCLESTQIYDYPFTLRIHIGKSLPGFIGSSCGMNDIIGVKLLSSNAELNNFLLDSVNLLRFMTTFYS